MDFFGPNNNLKCKVKLFRSADKHSSQSDTAGCAMTGIHRSSMCASPENIIIKIQ